MTFRCHDEDHTGRLTATMIPLIVYTQCVNHMFTRRCLVFVAALFCSRADHLYSLRGDSNGQEVIEEKNKSPEERDQVPQGKDREAGKQGQEAQKEAQKGKMINKRPR